MTLRREIKSLVNLRRESGRHRLLAGAVRSRLVNIRLYQGRQRRILRESSMVAAISLISVVLGAAVAYVADRFPTHIETLEMSAGALLIGGFALLGSSLPVVL